MNKRKILGLTGLVTGALWFGGLTGCVHDGSAINELNFGLQLKRTEENRVVVGKDVDQNPGQVLSENRPSVYDTPKVNMETYQKIQAYDPLRVKR